MARPSFSSSLAALAAAALLCVLLMQAAPAAASAKAAAACDLMQLSSCVSALGGQGAPPSACCSKLKAQGPGCLCLYKDDPNLKRLVSSKHTKRVFTACKLPAPSC